MTTCEQGSGWLNKRFSRRDLGKASLAAMALGLGGIGVHELIQSPQSDGYPEGFWERQGLIVPTKDDIQNELLKSDREYSRFTLQRPQAEGILFQGETRVPSHLISELTFRGIKTDIPSASVFKITANEKSRLITLISSPAPEDTAILFDPFETEDVYLQVEPVSVGKVPLKIDDFVDTLEVSYIVNDCLERDIQRSVSGVVPRVDNLNDLRMEAPYSRKTVVYYTEDGKKIFLNRISMICEKGGKDPRELYEQMRVPSDANAMGPGRTVDVEWDTEIIQGDDGAYEFPPKIQLARHQTGKYYGEYLNGIRPIVRIATLNNNFAPLLGRSRPDMHLASSDPDLSDGYFLYKPTVISHAEYEYVRNRPNKYVQWLSLEQLIEMGRLHGISDPIVEDFASYYPDDIGILYQNGNSHQDFTTNS